MAGIKGAVPTKENAPHTVTVRLMFNLQSLRFLVGRHISELAR